MASRELNARFKIQLDKRPASTINWTVGSAKSTVTWRPSPSAWRTRGSKPLINSESVTALSSRGWLRATANNDFVISAPRSTAVMERETNFDNFSSPVTFSCIAINCRLPSVTNKRLLKSWAKPPAKAPKDSMRSDCAERIAKLRRSVASKECNRPSGFFVFGPIGLASSSKMRIVLSVSSSANSAYPGPPSRACCNKSVTNRARPDCAFRSKSSITGKPGIFVENFSRTSLLAITTRKSASKTTDMPGVVSRAASRSDSRR